MRVLAICARFPPEHVGGYELACADVLQGLAGRGHTCLALSASFGRGNRAERLDHVQVERWLEYLPLPAAQAEPIARRALREWRCQAACRDALRRFRPDVVSVWDLWGLPPSLPAVCLRSGLPVTYAIASPWPLDYRDNPDRWAAAWQGRPEPAPRAAFRALARATANAGMVTEAPPPDLQAAFFVSEALRRMHGVGSADGAPVIHLGVDIERFQPAEALPRPGPLRLLVSGRVTPEKGVETAIEALGRLGEASVRLDVVGPEPDLAYLARLRRLVHDLGLGDRVRFAGQAPRDAMPRTYRTHGALVFPSVWQEPFALTLLEAMACGLPIVSTLTGGSGEAIEDGVTGLAFPSGDAGALAACIRRLIDEPGLRRALGARARARVEREFRLEQTVEAVEEFLTLCRPLSPAPLPYEGRGPGAGSIPGSGRSFVV